jgi:hypothetical protein
MEHRAAHQSFRLAASSFEGCGRLSALHRGDFCPRVRVSWFMDRSGGPWRHPFAGRRRFGGPATIGPFPVQRAPRGGVLMPPDRVPGPPECGVTSPARRRRIRSHLRNVSRRRPQPNRTIWNIIIVGFKSRAAAVLAYSHFFHLKYASGSTATTTISRSANG